MLNHRVPHSDSNHHADGHRNLPRHEVSHHVRTQQVSGTHCVRRTRTQVKTAGRTNHGRSGCTTNAQRDQQRIDGSHQQKAQTHGRVNEQSHALTNEIRQTQQNVGRANGRKRTNTKFHQRLRSTDFIHVVRETGNSHNVKTQATQATLHKVGKCLNKVKAPEVS